MTTELEKRIQTNYTSVTQRIIAAAKRAGRDPAEITLVAVTKTWPAEVPIAAYRVGMRQFGENRAEELAQKRTAVAETLGAAANETIWHQIGTLQSRKSGLTADHADVFHALDRVKIANRLSRQLESNGRSLPTFLEVNLSGESSKSGFQANHWEEDATQRQNLRTVIKSIVQLPGLDLQGLMTMAPWGVDEEIIRNVFRRTRLLTEWLNSEFGSANLTKISMGMTDDFEIGIEEGATHIRVGRALFGSRY